jgi:hypothetical protein
MSSVHPGSPGATRGARTAGRRFSSAGVCPACRHYLRFDHGRRPRAPAVTPLRIEGSIRHPADGELGIRWSYRFATIAAEEIAHKLIGVGAMNPNEQRIFTLSVEAVSAKTRTPAKGGTRH